MGFLTRAVVPRSVRRAANPVRTAKSAATPRVVKQARSALNPIDAAVYAAERELNTKSRPQGSRTQAPDEAPGNTPEQNRAIDRAVLAAVCAVVVVYVVLSLIFGWATVLACTVAFGLFGLWVAKELKSD